MINAVIASFKQSPEGFHTVCVCFPFNIFSDRVMYGFMLVSLFLKPVVAFMLIGVNG